MYLPQASVILGEFMSSIISDTKLKDLGILKIRDNDLNACTGMIHKHEMHKTNVYGLSNSEG